jgi:hypothetical protein
MMSNSASLSVAGVVLVQVDVALFQVKPIIFITLPPSVAKLSLGFDPSRMAYIILSTPNLGEYLGSGCIDGTLLKPATDAAMLAPDAAALLNASVKVEACPLTCFPTALRAL